MNVAMHAVKPECPRCGRQVRGSVELQAELADLVREAQALYAMRPVTQVHSLEEAADYDVLTARLRARLEELEAELRGGHLACGPTVH